MRGFTFTSVIVLVVVVAVVGIAAVLLARTVQEAQAINAKAQNIAVNGRGINTATDSIIQLRRTNAMARSILASAQPLEPRLGRIVATATGIDVRAGSINSNAVSINGTARSINDSAVTINDRADSINQSAGRINQTAGAINRSAGEIRQSAGTINQTAGTINRTAGTINTRATRIDSLADSILGTAREIDTDVRLINQNLDVTLGLAGAIKDDTANILGEAGEANETAACIDRKLNGQSGSDGDCQGQTEPIQEQRRSVLIEDPDDLRRALGAPERAASDDESEERPRRSSLPELPGLPDLPGLPPLTDLPQLRNLTDLTDLTDLAELPDTQKELDKLLDDLLPLVEGSDRGRLTDDLTRRLLPGLNLR